MSGFKEDLDELDEELGADDDYLYDDEGDDEEGGGKSKSGKKSKSEGSSFDRDSYYFYKDKLVQLSGTIKPKERTKEGKVVSLEFKTDDKNYVVIMDEMGKKLLSACFQEFLVTGLVSKITEKEYTLAIKTYI